KHLPGDTDTGRFVDALLAELDHHQKNHPLTPETIYLGGGTPSMLSPGHLRLLFDGLAEALPLSNTHITFEANPATFGESKAALFKELGVNRTSLGIQSFTPHVLQTLGREHSAEQAIESVQILQSCGMDEVNIDLMFSIPGQSINDWQETLDTAVNLKPDHISAYNLTYEEDTEFIDRLTSGQYREDEDANADHYLAAHHTLTDNGFLHYETSNYAQPGKQSRHNQAYWQGVDYLGLGPSAVSTVNGNRWKNLPDTAGYIHAIETFGHAKREEEIIDEEAFRIERIALLLRTTDGLPIHYLTTSPAGHVEQLIEEELAEISDGNLCLTRNGRMLVDPIAERLV
ncbi:MAG: radical SAM family heme chaperone HemW, partial [Akkermansiaceae bacterium]